MFYTSFDATRNSSICTGALHHAAPDPSPAGSACGWRTLFPSALRRMTQNAKVHMQAVFLRRKVNNPLPVTTLWME